MPTCDIGYMNYRFLYKNCLLYNTILQSLQQLTIVISKSSYMILLYIEYSIQVPTLEKKNIDL